MPESSRIPDLPGDIVPNDHTDFLRRLVARICHIDTLRLVLAFQLCKSRGHYIPRFPGSQPVSFSQRDLDRLENEEYVFENTSR